MSTVKILLADDHKIVIDGLRLILSSNSHFEVVGEVENGQEVLDFLEKQKVHIVVLDINMPVMDGISACESIRRWERRHERSPITIVALTAHALDDYEKRAYQAGMQGFLTKPLDVRKLGGVLQSHMNAHSEA